MRVDQLIRYHAFQRPDNAALTLNERTLSYRELDQQANRIANSLSAEGIGLGDRVAIVGENSIEHILLMLGAAKIGAVTAALNYRLAGPELAFVIDDCEAKLLLVSDEELLDTISALELTHKPHLFCRTESAPKGWQSWDAWHGQSEASEPPSVTGQDDAFLQLYTSGTTGRPKGAVICHRNLRDLAFAGLVAAEIRLNIGDNELVMAPLFHIGAVASMFYTLIIGVQVILHSSFDPHAVADAIEEHHLSSLFMVPAMIQAILQAVPDLNKRDFSSLKRINYGASPIGEGLLTQAIETFSCDFQQSYGMTEASGAISQLTVSDHRKALAGRPELLASCGRPNAISQMRVVDDDGNTLADGELGEIVVKSTSVMLEYWKRPEQTAKTIRDGWLYTGDVGYRDAEGYFFLMDRKNDVVISGGENIYPNEVERVLLSHDSITDAAVIGIPDEKYGEALLAVCVVKNGAALNSEEMIEHCRAHLAGYKIPRQYRALESLPRNPSGKILKTALREPYWKGGGRQIG